MSLARTRIGAALAACLLGAACAGEPGDPGSDALVSFAYGPCGQSIPLQSGYDSAALAGLQCVVADTPASGQWSVALVNVWAGCTYEEQAPWAGAAAVEADGTLALEAEWQFDGVNGCGSCLYAFDYGIEPFDLGSSLRIALTVASCSGAGCADPPLVATIAPSAEAPALACRYLIRAPGYENLECDDGQLYCEPVVHGGCAEGLVPRVVEFDPEDSLALCLPACDVDEDCPLPEIEGCAAGACVIEDPLEIVWVPER